MSVRVGNEKSNPRSVPGGSPQGSIMGNFLFCSTTNTFTQLDGESRSLTPYISDNISTDTNTSGSPQASRPNETCHISTPSARGQFAQFRPPGNLEDLEGSYESVDDSFDFFRARQRYSFDTSSSDSAPDTTAIKTVSETGKSIENYVYIDDFNAPETLNIKNAMSHITTHKCSLDVRAIKSERLFTRINEKAEEIGMRVNSEKTQMLCIHPCINNTVKTHIVHEEERITSTDDLKINIRFHFRHQA